MRKFTEIHEAQARLLNLASLLMQAGVDETIYTTAYPQIGRFDFNFMDINISFSKDHPFDMAEVDDAAEHLKEIIKQKKEDARIMLNVLQRGF